MVAQTAQMFALMVQSDMKQNLLMTTESEKTDELQLLIQHCAKAVVLAQLLAHQVLWICLDSLTVKLWRR